MDTGKWLFKSIVCVDLETSNLPSYDNNVKITEVCFIGIVRDHIDPNGTITLPRTTHKLTFTVNPTKAIHFSASEVSGLYNDFLEPIEKWTEKQAKMLLTFLDLLPPPVCLVAHNGNKFDFPILKKHFDLVGVSLPEHILCVDSLPAFREIMPELQADAAIKTMKNEMASDNETIIKVAEEFEKQLEVCKDNKDLSSYILKPNEKTPDSKLCRSSTNSISPVNSSAKSVNVSRQSPFRTRRCLFVSKPRVSYKLSEIYQQLFGDYPDVCHNAEDDALTLLKCILKTFPKFSKWANEHYKLFSNFK